MTDSLQIIERSAGFHGVFASESLRTGQIKLTREEGEGREWCRKTKIAIKNRIRFDNKTWKQVEMKSFWTKNFECHKTVTSFWKLRELVWIQPCKLTVIAIAIGT